MDIAVVVEKFVNMRCIVYMVKVSSYMEGRLAYIYTHQIICHFKEAQSWNTQVYKQKHQDKLNLLCYSTYI